MSEKKYSAFFSVVVTYCLYDIAGESLEDARKKLIVDLEAHGTPENAEVFDEEIQYGRIAVFDDDSILRPDGPTNAKTDEEARLVELYNANVLHLAKLILLDEKDGLESLARQFLVDAKKKGLR